MVVVYCYHSTVSTLSRNDTRKRLTGAACRSSSSCLVDARYVQFHKSRALSREPRANCD